jgi:hypothetical protein
VGGREGGVVRERGRAGGRESNEHLATYHHHTHTHTHTHTQTHTHIRTPRHIPPSHTDSQHQHIIFYVNARARARSLSLPAKHLQRKIPQSGPTGSLLQLLRCQYSHFCTSKATHHTSKISNRVKRVN